ncbi:MAG: DUF2652 domain-containing protein [Verrucomicrobia bacterium]|nr:DUF2652 domain-containing protein [Verrucomicrobiota bacterium]
MKLRRAHIILVDISGYTQFIHRHRLSLIHAERIITELLECVIDASEHPLTLNKLEGDAALFYALIEEGDESSAGERERQSATAVLRQLQRFFAAFQNREQELVSECTMCACEACAKSGELRLKVIAHTGTILLKRVRQFEEIAGEDVIVAHRLLKNSVPSHEYLLLTEPFHALSGPPHDAPLETFTENCEGTGMIRIHVHYPSGASALKAHPVSFWRKLMTNIRLESHLVKRLFMKPARPFHHLPRVQNDAVSEA